jgi:hypothetical protein
LTTTVSHALEIACASRNANVTTPLGSCVRSAVRTASGTVLYMCQQKRDLVRRRLLRERLGCDLLPVGLRTVPYTAYGRIMKITHGPQRRLKANAVEGTVWP